MPETDEFGETQTEVPAASPAPVPAAEMSTEQIMRQNAIMMNDLMRLHALANDANDSRTTALESLISEFAAAATTVATTGGAGTPARTLPNDGSWINEPTRFPATTERMAPVEAEGPDGTLVASPILFRPKLGVG